MPHDNYYYEAILQLLISRYLVNGYTQIVYADVTNYLILDLGGKRGPPFTKVTISTQVWVYKCCQSAISN